MEGCTGSSSIGSAAALPTLSEGAASSTDQKALDQANPADSELLKAPHPFSRPPGERDIEGFVQLLIGSEECPLFGTKASGRRKDCGCSRTQIDAPTAVVFLESIAALSAKQKKQKIHELMANSVSTKELLVPIGEDGQNVALCAGSFCRLLNILQREWRACVLGSKLATGPRALSEATIEHLWTFIADNIQASENISYKKLYLFYKESLEEKGQKPVGIEKFRQVYKSSGGKSSKEGNKCCGAPFGCNKLAMNCSGSGAGTSWKTCKTMEGKTHLFTDDEAKTIIRKYRTEQARIKKAAKDGAKREKRDAAKAAMEAESLKTKTLHEAGAQTAAPALCSSLEEEYFARMAEREAAKVAMEAEALNEAGAQTPVPTPCVSVEEDYYIESI